MFPVDHFNRHVSSVDDFVVFYTDALGYVLLKRGLKANGKPFAILKGAGHELFLSEKDGFQPETELSFRHVGYAVPDADAMLAELKRKGYVEESRQIIVKPYSRQVYIQDPDGLEVDLIQWTDKPSFYTNT